jgi:guanylate kinase
MSGTLIIVTAPSGAGKTTLVRKLLEREPKVQLSISYTTRAPRVGEQDGVDYHFVDAAQFLAMRSRDEFLESAEVYGNYYGTSKVWIQEQMASDRDILLEIDWQGAQQVHAVFPEAVRVFILPPSLDELHRRLTGRGTDSPDVIARRMLAARGEMRHVSESDYVILNEDVETALNDLCAVVQASRLRFANQRDRYPQFFEIIQQD